MNVRTRGCPGNVAGPNDDATRPELPRARQSGRPVNVPRARSQPHPRPTIASAGSKVSPVPVHSAAPARRHARRMNHVGRVCGKPLPSRPATPHPSPTTRSSGSQCSRRACAATRSHSVDRDRTTARFRRMQPERPGIHAALQAQRHGVWIGAESRCSSRQAAWRA